MHGIGGARRLRSTVQGAGDPVPGPEAGDAVLGPETGLVPAPISQPRPGGCSARKVVARRQSRFHVRWRQQVALPPEPRHFLQELELQNHSSAVETIWDMHLFNHEQAQVGSSSKPWPQPRSHSPSAHRWGNAQSPGQHSPQLHCPGGNLLPGAQSPSQRRG